MRDALAVDATDARAMRTETAEDIREPLDQLIKGAETDLDITGRRINGHREGIAAATVLDEPTVLPIEPAKAGKGGEGGDFQITNAEFIAAVFPHLREGASAAVCSKRGNPDLGDGLAAAPIKLPPVLPPRTTITSAVRSSIPVMTVRSRRARLSLPPATSCCSMTSARRFRWIVWTASSCPG
jgi:hypothetical protein